MKATETLLANLLKGPRQFLIPIYQRRYSWDEEQCRQLWEDVLRVANDEYPAHFVGSVVYVEHGLYQATAVPQLLVIDGQQRLTTFTLMVEAIARAIGDGEPTQTTEITARKLRNYFLFNPEEDGDLRYKLQLSEADAQTLRAILDQKPFPEVPANRLVDNFALFQHFIAEAAVAPEVIYRGLSKLMVVDVSLDRDHDNPQLIFESLNSTGLDLSQSDLIRNFVLMGLEPIEQTELYKDYWRPMERTLAHATRGNEFDRFLRAWLSLRLGEVPKLQRGYENFKRYRVMNLKRPIAAIVADMHRCANNYAAIALGRELHPQLAHAFRGLHDLKVDAPMPFLLHAYALWQDGVLSEQDMIEVARLMESWVFRRAVCDIPSNVLSRTFARLPEQLDDEMLLESLSAYLASRSKRQRFPSDEEFRAALETRNLYEFKHRQYFLSRLENYERKEQVVIGEFTVEHVLPQNENLLPEWREVLGPEWRAVQEKWLHTLGNLTLTGYNPEMSDRSFAEKRDMEGGFRESPIRLNRMLAKRDSWDAAAIEERGRELSKKALAIWSLPRPSSELLNQYRSESGRKRRTPWTSVDHLRMTEATKELYDALVGGAGAAGFVPTIRRQWIGVGEPGRGKPFPIIVRPRRGWLLVCLRVPFDDLQAPPTCAYSHETKTGSQKTRAKLHTLSHVADCLALLPHVARVNGGAESHLDGG